MAGRAVTKSGRRLCLALLIHALANHDMTRGDQASSRGDGPKYGCGLPGCSETITKAQYDDFKARGTPKTCPKHDDRKMTQEIR